MGYLTTKGEIGGAVFATMLALSGSALAQAPVENRPTASFQAEAAPTQPATAPPAQQPAAPQPATQPAPAPQPYGGQPAPATQPAAEPYGAQPAQPYAAQPAPVASPYPSPYPYDGPVGPNHLAKNSAFIELLGPGLIYSLNYERIVADAVGIRVGISGWGASTNGNSSLAFTVPVTISYLGIRDRQHIFEVGGGGTYLHSDQKTSDGANVVAVSGSGGLAVLYGGYRLHPVDKIGFQFRAGLGVQAMFINGQSIIYPWPYLSLGAGF